MNIYFKEMIKGNSSYLNKYTTFNVLTHDPRKPCWPPISNGSPPASMQWSSFVNISVPRAPKFVNRSLQIPAFVFYYLIYFLKIYVQ